MSDDKIDGFDTSSVVNLHPYFYDNKPKPKQTKENNMNQEEAERKLETKIKNWVPNFCPLIKNSCRSDCECFVEYRAKYNPIDNTWFIFGGYCNNKMLHSD